MAITTLFNTGFEHGLASALGAGLISSITGAGTSVSSTNPRNGGFCLHVVGPGATIEAWQATFAAAQTKLVSRFAIKLSGRPASGFANLAFAGATWTLRALPTGQLTMLLGAGTSNGPIIDTTGWHLIEVQIDVSGNPWTLNWSVDGVGQPALSNAVAGSTIGNQALGEVGTAGAAFTCDYDDWIVGSYTTAATDWYGNGKGLSYLAASDGTHVTPADFKQGDAGASFSGATTNANTFVDDPAPWTATRSTTDSISQAVIAAGAYMEILCAASSERARANAVRALIGVSSVNVNGNTAGTIALNSAGTSTPIFGDLPVAQGGGGGALANYSLTSNNFKAALVPTPAAGWTSAEVNSVKVRFGGAGDVTPVPTLQMLMLEVDWPVLPPTPPVVVPGVATAVASVR